MKHFERIDAVAIRADEIRLAEHGGDFGSESRVGSDLLLRRCAQRRDPRAREGNPMLIVKPLKIDRLLSSLLRRWAQLRASSALGRTPRKLERRSYAGRIAALNRWAALPH